MDDVQFIIESPQNNQGHKKRPRLVTSCDNWLAYSFPLYPFPLLTHIQPIEEDKMSTTIS